MRRSRLLISATSRVDAARNLVTRTSTQEDAWLVLAARALGKQGVSLKTNQGGETATHTGPLYLTL